MMLINKHLPSPAVNEELESLNAQVENLQKENSTQKERSAVTFVHNIVDFEAIRVSKAAR